jgi:hypothetical protein
MRGEAMIKVQSISTKIARIRPLKTLLLLSKASLLSISDTYRIVISNNLTNSMRLMKESLISKGDILD